MAARQEKHTIGQRIAIRRRLLDMQQDRLAELCDVDPSLVRDWEANRVKPRSRKMNVVADALAVTVEWLRDGEGSFGQRVALRRKQLKLTQDGLARLLGGEVARRTIVDWESDKAWPHPRTQRAIAEKLRVPLYWLLSGEGLPGTPKLSTTPIDDGRFLSGVAHLKLALALRYDREVERLLLLQNGALKRAESGREALPVHAKYAIASALGWPLDPPTVLAMLSDAQREKVKKMSKHFDDVTLVRIRVPRMRRKARRSPSTTNGVKVARAI